MRTPRLLYWLTAYYLGISAALLAAGFLWPDVRLYLPVGGVEALVAGPERSLLEGMPTTARAAGFGPSLLWLIVAIIGSLLAALPVSWTYMEIRSRHEYNQSLVQTVVVLPMVVTGIVVVVQNSLALAFSLAGIAAGVRFRNALKSPGDALFVLLSIGMGLASGIGATELAMVMSIAFNYCFLILWINDYGAREGTQRYMHREEPEGDAPAAPPAGAEGG